MGHPPALLRYIQCVCGTTLCVPTGDVVPTGDIAPIIDVQTGDLVATNRTLYL